MEVRESCLHSDSFTKTPFVGSKNYPKAFRYKIINDITFNGEMRNRKYNNITHHNGNFLNKNNKSQAAQLIERKV